MSISLSLKEYLKSHLHASSIATHLTNIASMISYLGESKAENVVYKDILEYIAVLRNKYKKVATVQSHLKSIKRYYGYLLHIGKRKDHPCRYFLLKDAPYRTVQLQDLLNPEELETLLHLPKYPRKVEQRTKVLLSLLVHQGLTTGELLNVETQDVDYDKGTIHIRAGTVSNARTLPLKAEQVMLLYKYVREERQELLARGKQRDSGKLVLSCLGASGQKIIFTHLMRRIRKYFPGKQLTAGKIRQSVIANMLKSGKDLRLVQAYAGHKYTDSTERYRERGIEALKAAIQKYHPLADVALA